MGFRWLRPSAVEDYGLRSLIPTGLEGTRRRGCGESPGRCVILGVRVFVQLLTQLRMGYYFAYHTDQDVGVASYPASDQEYVGHEGNTAQATRTAEEV